jgi:hypothetical protein
LLGSATIAISSSDVQQMTISHKSSTERRRSHSKASATAFDNAINYSPATLICATAMVVIALVCRLTWFVTAGDGLLPAVFRNGVQKSQYLSLLLLATSGLGQSRPKLTIQVTSAYPPRTEVQRASPLVRLVPMNRHDLLFDHLVGAY